jgi:CrcB protein
MVGATARFELAHLWAAPPGRFPWATFGANVSGSFLLGFLLVWLLERFPPTRYLRPFLATGILGAYTTMSTYLVETAVLIKDGHAVTGLVYGTGSLATGLGLAYAGMASARLAKISARQEKP